MEKTGSKKVVKYIASQHDRYFKPGTMLFPLRKYMSGAQQYFLSVYVKPGISALDLGSGPGFFTIRMSEQIGSNGVVYAVDGDEAAVARLREMDKK
jgi:ubiquinone/menaquinone biosynthesis C-methylase UbiE